MVDAWFFWLDPKGKVVPLRKGDENHFDALYRKGVSPEEAYGLGWIRVGPSSIEGTPEAIMRYKDRLSDEMGWPDRIVVDFHVDGDMIPVETDFIELGELTPKMLVERERQRRRMGIPFDARVPGVFRHQRPVRIRSHTRRRLS